MTSMPYLIKTHWVSFTLFTLTAITVLSLWPLENLPTVPGTDKTHHLIAYAALMFPVALRKPSGWIVIGLLFVAYSGVIELLQPFVNRYGEWMDLAANSAGVVGGIAIAGLMNRLLPE
jgi:VanZ family protein